MKREKVKNQQRLRRKKRVRAKIFGNAERPRLAIKRSNRHLHFQVIDDNQRHTLVAASTLEFKKNKNKETKSESAALIGKILAEKAKKAGILKMALDRSHYKYHGRLKAAIEEIKKFGIQI